MFYLGDDSKYYAYWPKEYKGKKTTLQSRNALIGNFTEKYSVDLLQDFAESKKIYAIQGAICDEIGLSRQSPADVALCKLKKKTQKAQDILAIFEVKMSVVWNWEFTDGELFCIGDYKTHKGNPGLLRSDSMLKAIGKSINVRVSNYIAAQIPIVILGNTPITQSYYEKVDHLFSAGIIQGFWSVNSKPLDNDIENIKSTPRKGFIRMDSNKELIMSLNNLFSEKREFFSSMQSKERLGEIIEIANQEMELENKAKVFLKLIRETNGKY